MEVITLMEKKMLEKNDNKTNDLELFSTVGVNREFVEKLTLAMNHVTKPFDLQFGKKMRVVIDYDPQNPQVKFSYFTEAELEKKE